MKRSVRRLGLLLLLSAISVLIGIGCANRDLQPLNPCTVAASKRDVSINPIKDVDLLFVMDKSTSMEAEQVKIASQIRNIVTQLTTGYDEDSDGIPDYPAVESLRVATVSTDIGVASPVVTTADPRCVANTNAGILSSSAVAGSGCVGPYNAYETFDATSSLTPAGFADLVGCTAVLGADGCGIEQQFESMLRVLTPSSSSLRFFGVDGMMNATGTADAAANLVTNDATPPQAEPFLRDGALLAIVMVTDEDDCSLADPVGFGAGTGRTWQGTLNSRCGEVDKSDPENSRYLHPISRYVNGLKALGSDKTIVFAAISGIDPAHVESEHDIYSDPLYTMPVVNTSGSQAVLTPICQTTEACTMGQTGCTCMGATCTRPSTADPGLRVAQLVDALAAEEIPTTLQTICAGDFGPAVRVINELIAKSLGGTCLPRSINVDAGGEVNCRVHEYIEPTRNATCESLPGRIASNRTDDQGRTVCEIVQLPVDRVTPAEPTGDGWFYDDFTPAVTGADVNIKQECSTGFRLAFAYQNRDVAIPFVDSEIQFECLQTLTGTGAATINSTCDYKEESGKGCNDYSPGETTAAEREALAVNCICSGSDDLHRLGPKPFCEKNNTCQLECASDADCPGGYVCVPSAGTKEGDVVVGICSNPTCS